MELPTALATVVIFNFVTMWNEYVFALVFLDAPGLNTVPLALDAFRAGEIDCLAIDHAPHSLEENKRGISGVPHLDTYGAFVTWLAAQGMEWGDLVDRTSRRPAELFSPFGSESVGSLEPGKLASFAVVAPEHPWEVRSEDLQTRAGWSPFEGFEFPGRVTMTAVRGTLYVMR